MTLDFTTYLSPFTWRYGSPAMRRLWSESEKRRLWRQIWVALAETEAEFGLISPEQVADLQKAQEAVDVPRALEIEAEIQHDLMAELRTFADQAPLGGGILHLGATSADIEDNADVLRMRQALDLVLQASASLLEQFAVKIETYADLPILAFTHWQPAEPTTLGYRLAFYAQDLLLDHQALQAWRSRLRGKGLRGAVGTGASYGELLGVERLAEFNARLAEKIGLEFFVVTTQVYSRRQDFGVICALASLGAVLHKFALDLRLLQSPPFGEWSEPFGRQQVGSSAMPFKRNPIQAEKINSLARQLAQLPRLAWDNAAHSALERTLDDSANRRTLLPEAFLITDELLRTANRLVAGLRVDTEAAGRNLAAYAPFAAVERLLMALGKAGADRQAMHERLRQHALQAWEALRQGGVNPLPELLKADPEIQRFLSAEQLQHTLDVSQYLGDAPARARQLAAQIRQALAC